MGISISRRDFIKTTSVVGLATAANPVQMMAQPAAKSRVVIATDLSSIGGDGKVVAGKVQPMVDATIMALTGKATLAAAYEALFPAPVTAATKILLKRNDISGSGAVNTAVINALKTGLTSMLNGTFPAANITIRCSGGSAKAQTAAATYIINCPVCHCHGTGYGVTLSLKNTMTYLNQASAYHSADKKWLHQVSLDPAIKPKQVLTFLDALVGNNQDGPGTSMTFNAGVLIVSKDLVSADYHALRLLAKMPKASAPRIATGDGQLKAAEAAGLGTCTPANMEVINITPPWGTTGIISQPDLSQQPFEFTTLKKGNGVEFAIAGSIAQSFDFTVFDMKGSMVRHIPGITDNRVFWNFRSQNEALVPAGMYIFWIQRGLAKVKGTIMVSS